MPGKNLTRTEAETRSGLIRNPKYEVSLDLTKGPKTFLSTSHVTFDAKPGCDAWIDLIAPKVLKITLNGAELNPDDVFRDCRIALRGLQDHNDLTVVAQCEYSHTGEGLHRATDTADGLVYLYTQFEVMDCRRVYAVFDQPDIKGTFIFTVRAPKSWNAITSTMLPTSHKTVPGVKTDPATLSDGVIDDVVEWEFPETPKMSSYLTSLVAGPYAEWHDDSYVNADGRTIPMALYCRQSIKDGLDKDAAYLFDEVQKGFTFYAKLFGIPYPYQKYDQIFVPEYNAGAMENIGNVTVVDSYVFQSKVSDAVADRRVSSLLHELAHMWFGDLVTMKWWNDLWLNESFAEFMCTLSTAEATEWKTEWATFASGEKSWGEEQDQLPTTHPIVAPINDINDTEANFDGITYAKGGSVLKQLMAYVGRDNFFKGIHSYLTKHSYGNATLNDLLAELNAASGRDLDAWSKLWLQESGINTLTTKVATDADGVITKFAVEQKGSANNGVLRPHTLKIGFYGLQDGKVVRLDSFQEDIDAAPSTEIADLVGKKRPEFILLNDDDLTYAKLRFDQQSLDFLEDHLADFDDALARAVASLALWDMTRDAEYPAEKYIKVTLTQLARENQATTFKTILAGLMTTVRQYVAPARSAAMLESTSEALWKLTTEAEAGSDAQFQLLGAYLGLGADKDFESHARGLLSGELSLPGLEVDNNLRWTILISLARVGAVDDDEIKAELDKDDSIANREFAYRARASRPTAEAKKWAWDSAMDPDALTNSQLRAVVLGFASGSDPKLYEGYIKPFFDAINTVWTTRTYHSSETMLGSCVSAYSLYPAPAPTDELIAAANEWLAANKDKDHALLGAIEDDLAATLRMQKAQKYNAAL